jgi:hypothetical protein
MVPWYCKRKLRKDDAASQYVSGELLDEGTIGSTRSVALVLVPPTA